MKAEKLFSKEQKNQIVEAIKLAESNTSAEIKVHIESLCKENALDRATELFAKLKMHKTKDRNGVLIYVAIESRKCAILGDKGINAVVKEQFWQQCYDVMRTHFQSQDYSGGIASVVAMCGEYFSEHFHYQQDDQNELSDEISFE